MSVKVIVSSLVDSQVLSYLPDMDIRFFKTLADLDTYVADNPLRAVDLIITQDVTRDNPNQMFTLLSNICNSTFFRSENLIYITPPLSREINMIRFLQNDGSLSNVTVLEGDLTKEYLISVIKGEASGRNARVTRKAVVRKRVSDYKEEVLRTTLPDDDFVRTDELKLCILPKITEFQTNIIDTPITGSLIQITGLLNSPRAEFSVLLAQYMAIHGKTLLLETDMRYFTTSYLLHQAGIDYDKIPLNSFYRNPIGFIEQVGGSEHNLVCLTGTSKDINADIRVYSILNTLYSSLKHNIKYFIYLTELHDILPSVQTVICMNNDLLSVLETINNLPVESSLYMDYVAIDRNVDEVAIRDGRLLSSMVSELINHNVDVDLFSFKSVKLGGEPIDLYRYVKRHLA
jgi:hypothetical protein